jgi:hypothetical protein
MNMRSVLALSLLLWVRADAQAPTSDRIIGLLTLPQVFGSGPCVPFEPQPVPLFARPRAQKPIAEVRVDKYWTFHNNGGCDELEVRIHEPGRSVTPMPAKEYGYELPAAIVVARDREWFQIRTAERPLWVRGTAENSFLSLVQLVSDSLAYLTQDWDGSIYTNPDGSRARMPIMPPEASVRVLGSRVVSDRLWLLVESEDGCALPDSSKTVKVRGWVRAYARNEAPAVWFHSRGC